MENKKNLDSKQESLVAISALTAIGNIDQLKISLNQGLENGLTINEIKEELVQLYAYCGFPRSLNAVNAFMAVLDERKKKGITDTEGRETSSVNIADKYNYGKSTLEKLTGVEEKGPKKGANGFAPLIDTFLKEHLFADIFSRDILSYQQRELITISTLATLSGVQDQLRGHIGIGLNIGIPEAQLSQAFRLVGTLIDANQGAEAEKILKTIVASKTAN